jgi:arylsulfatase A-like enzyme
VIIIDDLAIADSAFMPGGAARYHTPTLNKLASESLILGNFHAVTPICTPSRFSLLTGSYPSKSKATFQSYRLKLEGAAVPEFDAQLTAGDMTLPKRLKEMGFRTGFAGKDHVVEHRDYQLPLTINGSSGGVAGKTSLYDPGVPAKLEADRQTAIAGLQAVGFDEVYSVFPNNALELPVKELQAHNLDWIVDGAKRFIDGNSNEKFFLVVSLTIPHGPLNPANSWNADPRITPYGYLSEAPNVLPARSTLTSRVNAAGFPGTENYLWLDDSIAAILDALQSKGVKDKTAIFVIGDHGMAAKGSIYRSGSHTPAFVNYRNRRGYISQLLANVDLPPTIAEMLGGSFAGDGVSMLPVLEGSSAPVRQHVYMELGYARAILTNEWQYIAVRHTNYIRQRAAERGFPLAHWPNHGNLHILERQVMPLFPNYLDLDQFYDIQADPKQQTNLFGQPQYQAVIDQLRAVMAEEAAKTPGAFKVS